MSKQILVLIVITAFMFTSTGLSARTSLSASEARNKRSVSLKKEKGKEAESSKIKPVEKAESPQEPQSEAEVEAEVEVEVEAKAEVKAEVEGEEDVDIHAIPPILDPEYRHRKRHQFEFTPFGGAYLGNTIGQTWFAGAKMLFYLNNYFAVGGSYGISKLLTNRSSNFGRSIRDDNMQIANAEFIISTDSAMAIGKSMVELDLYLTLGVGGMELNNEWIPVGVIGGGTKIYTGLAWLAIKIDVNSYAHNVSQPGKDIVDFDLAILGGICFLFPHTPSPYEKN